MNMDMLEEPQTTQQAKSLIDLVRHWYEQLETLKMYCGTAKGFSALSTDEARAKAVVANHRAIERLEKVSGEMDLWLASVE
jgi:hypothetical protein